MSIGDSMGFKRDPGDFRGFEESPRGFQRIPGGLRCVKGRLRSVSLGIPGELMAL